IHPLSRPWFFRSKKKKSYAQAVKTANVSLLHENFKPPLGSDNCSMQTIHSRIYRTARSANALLIDITHAKKNYTDLQAMIALKKQHPGTHACAVLTDGNTRYLEAYIDPECDDNQLEMNGIQFVDSNIKVIPCRAFDDETKSVHLSLRNLPMFNKKRVLEGLKQSLQIYGQILDVGLNENEAGLYMGGGYAILNIFQKENTPWAQRFVPLSHRISWCESADDIFYATWNDMPTWCRYCHKEGHTKFECEISKARILCYNCHQNGHRSFECPRRNTEDSNSTKKSRKTGEKNKIVQEIEHPKSFQSHI
ncbi:hypothetical protein BY458DRAFT_447218, partial [Sporodiniella umbellata]